MVITSDQAQSQQELEKRLIPTAARYLPESRELEISFGNHFKGRWPIDSLQMLRIGEHGWERLPSPTDAELAEVILWEGKDVVEFPTIDQHYSIPALLRGQLGSKQWMQQITANA
ncbi:MAG: hypothetical protein AAGL08_14760 [Cyanobacteria bacterium J06573_11]